MRRGAVVVLIALALVCGACRGQAALPVVFSTLIYSDAQTLLGDYADMVDLRIFSQDVALESQVMDARPQVMVLSDWPTFLRLRQNGAVADHGLDTTGFEPGACGSDYFLLGASPQVFLYNRETLGRVPTSYFGLGDVAFLGLAMVDPLSDPYYHAAAYHFAGADDFAALWEQIARGDVYFCDSARAAALRVHEGQSALALTGYGDALDMMAQNPALDFVLPDQKSGMLGTPVRGYICALGAGSDQAFERDILARLADIESEKWLLEEGILPMGLRAAPQVQPLYGDPQAILDAQSSAGDAILAALP